MPHTYSPNYYRKHRNRILATNEQWRQRNLEKKITQNRDYYRKNREEIILRRRLRKHGLTEAAFDQLWAEQNGLCAICFCGMVKKSHQSDSVNIDHCHESGAVRGLLCSLCNCAIGMMQDDPVVLRSAIEYLAGAPR